MNDSDKQGRQPLPADTRVASSGLPQAGELSPAALARVAVAVAVAQGDATPRTIGAYRLVQIIGEGGMGEVWRAEQERPIRRTVALKLIKLGMDTRQVIARFEAERQALALMNHPNVARVIDAGATDGGRPYFVMEYVPGAPITAFCDRHRYTTRQRLELFGQACAAVAHAHQKGIIHRDLKPGNILVTLQDDQPTVKVIDFGIAKATGGRLTDGTLLTELRQLVGTPQYMSPEQAETSDGADVDTRSDIYSLGVVLYELLTGTPPFDGVALRGKSVEEMQRLIREVAPPRPSTRLAALDAEALAAVAERRQADRRKLGVTLRGELDWVVMKCLEKDRRRRYETANGLAADVRRHLADEPVLARPPSTHYALRKLVRRHRVGLAVTSVAAASVVMLVAGAVYAAVRDARQRGRHLNELRAEQAITLEQKNRAEAAREDALAVNRFVGEMLQSVDPYSRPPGVAGPTTRTADTTVRDVLDRAAARLDDGVLKGQPATEAAVRMTLGRTYHGLGVYPQADAQLRAALDLRTRIHPGDDPDVAQSWKSVGLARRGWRDYAGAEEANRKAVEMQRRLFGEESLEVADTLTELADSRRKLTDYTRAERDVREALRIRKKRLDDDHPDVAGSHLQLGQVLLERRFYAESEAALREALRVRLKAFDNRHPRVGDVWHVLGGVRTESGDLEGGETAIRRALQVRREALGDGHPQFVSTLNDLGIVLLAQGRLAQAEGALREALALAPKAFPDGHPGPANFRHNLGDVLRAKGDLDGAEQSYAEAVRIWRQRYEDGPAGLEFSLSGNAAVRLVKGDRPGALTAARECADFVLRQVERLLATNPDDPLLLARRGEAFARLGRFEPAMRDYDKSIALDPTQLDAWYQRACLRLYLGDVDAYRNECQQMLSRLAMRDGFAGADRSTGGRVATVCLLSAESVGDSARLADLIDAALEPPTPVRLLPGFHQSKAIAEYRCGHYAQALTWLSTSRKGLLPGKWHALEFYEAMALHRFGRADKAREALARGVQRMDRESFEPGEGDLGMDGLDNWLIARIARREAEALILNTPATRATSNPAG